LTPNASLTNTVEADQLACVFNDSVGGEGLKIVAAIHLLVALVNSNLAVPAKVIWSEYTVVPEGIVIVCPLAILTVPVRSLGLVHVAELLKFPEPVLLVEV
jgi:hypothetical protein